MLVNGRSAAHKDVGPAKGEPFMRKRTEALVEALLDGITGYMVFQGRTGLWPAYSEYLLYPPIVAIASHLRWRVDCEYKLPKARGSRGDNKRLDFMLTHEGDGIAVPIEVKWPRNPQGGTSIVGDIRKLREVRPPVDAAIDARVLLVAGPHEIRKGGCEPVLRPRLAPMPGGLYRVRALGSGKRAWGVSAFLVEA